MASAGVISVDVQAKIDNFVKNLGKCVDKAQSFSSELDSSLNGKDYFGPIQRRADILSNSIKQMAFGIIFAQGFYQALGATKDAIAAVYEYTDALSYAETTFSNLFQDTELAEGFVAVLQQYAARSPFDFTDVEKAARQLSAYGIEAKNLMFVMEGIGNLAAISGDYSVTFERVSRAIGQINAKGKLMGEEMRQLAEAGINVGAVYDKLGTSAATLADDNIKAADAINAIVDVMTDNYSGALDAANTTMRGIVGNLKDMALMLSSSLARPLYEGVRSLLLNVVEEVDQFREFFTKGGLAYAIEQYFGPETLDNIANFVTNLLQIGYAIYQVLLPALTVAAVMSQTFGSVLLAILNIVLPFVVALSKLAQAFLSTEQGAAILRGTVVALTIAMFAMKAATLANMVIQALAKIMAVVATVIDATRIATQVYNATLRMTASTSLAAAAAQRAFLGSMNWNPVVVGIALIGSLIAMYVGLNAILGRTSATMASMSTFNVKDAIKGIKPSTGDVNKYNQRLDGTNSQLEDMQDNLAKTKKAAEKAVEGLLSFDEVFSLPDKQDPVGSGGELGDIATPGIGDFEIPDFSDVDLNLPEVDDLFGKWFDDIKKWWKDRDWADIAGYIYNGLVAAIKKFKLEVPEFGAKVLAALQRSLKNAKFTFPNFLTRIVTALREALAKRGIKFPKFGTIVSEGIEAAVKEAQYKFPNLADDVSKAATEALKKLKITLPEGVGKEVPEVVETAVKEAFETHTFTKLSASTIFKGLLSSLKEGLKAGLLTMAFDFVFDMIWEKLKEAGFEKAALIGENLGGILASGIAMKLVTKSTWAAIGAMVIDGLIDSIKEAVDTGDWTGTIDNIVAAVLALVGNGFSRKGGTGKGIGKRLGFAAVGTLIVQGILDAINEASETTDTTDTETAIQNLIVSTVSGAATGAMIGSIGGPWGALAGALVGALAGALTVAWPTIETWFNEKWTPFWNSLSSTINTVKENIGPIVSGLAKIVYGALVGDPESIKAGMEQLMPALDNVYWACLDTLVKMYDAFKIPLDAILKLFGYSTDEINLGVNELRFKLQAHEAGMGDDIEGYRIKLREELGIISQTYDTEGNLIADNSQSIADNTEKMKDSISKSLSETSQNTETHMGRISQTVKLNTDSTKTSNDSLKSNFDATKTGIINSTVKLSSDVKTKYDQINQTVQLSSTKNKTSLGKIKQGFVQNKTDINSTLTQTKSQMGGQYNSIVSLTGQQGSRIQNAFGPGHNLLLQAGYNIVSGLSRSLSSAFRGVINMVSGWGRWIASVKGPKSYDLKLLRPAGQWITSGLKDSLAEGFLPVVDMVSGFGDRISDAFEAPELPAASFEVPQLPSISTPEFIPMSGLRVPKREYVYAANQQMPQGSTQVVDNPFLTGETQTGDNSRPVLYVRTLIADKQGLRELKRQMDIVDAESSRFK